jgi:hypothetical protein
MPKSSDEWPPFLRIDENSEKPKHDPYLKIPDLTLREFLLHFITYLCYFFHFLDVKTQHFILVLSSAFEVLALHDLIPIIILFHFWEKYNISLLNKANDKSNNHIYFQRAIPTNFYFWKRKIYY